ncbi:Arc family DNA-binding protein [Agrobacterium rhizogenes]|nr:Arc family DNA-binding protein [Rhizobium rhizogenes]NTG25742.1 Arc family DNA-binding protein [Rhizobium rhizogenes]NTH62430.1 Arc family DNA-binding protein [Rhizobium rhizogenes]
MNGKVGRSSDQFSLRLPDGMRDRIKDIAMQNHRSINSEIVTMLEKHIRTGLETKSADATA